MTRPTTRFPTGIVVSSLLCALLIGSIARSADAPPAQKLTGPFTHENLTIFLVHGPGTLKGEFLTLEEAMKAKKVVVHETSNVNELSIENTGEVAVYVQSGDIVKGGKQDRTLGTDITLAPQSGKVAIAAFCVEHGRWQQRGGEAADAFSGSDSIVIGNAAKLAANANYASGGGQQKVWDEVAANQQKLSKSLKADVAATTSPSSLQLSLEHPKVQESVESYVSKLKNTIDGKENDDVIGYAFAINGKVVGADVYGSSALFRKLWPKLLKGAATEASAEMSPDKSKPIDPVSPGHVHDVLRTAEAGKRTTTAVNGTVEVTTAEAKESVMFECREKNSEAYLHRSYLKK
ncbi:MAG: DUF6569 family protein [Tepidisphaeraceae bacterium]